MGISAKHRALRLLRTVFYAVFVILTTTISFAQSSLAADLPAKTDPPTNNIVFTAGPVTIPAIDSVPSLNDFEGMKPSSELARRMAKIDHFVQRNPSNGSAVSQRTEAYVGYTKKNLYVVFLCFDTEPNKIRAHMNRREDIQEDDQIGFMIDSFNDHRHAYTFYINPVNVQQDGIFTEGKEPDLSFDTIWNSAAHMTKEGYVAWFEIPFKSLRFPPTAEQKWGILFERDIPRNNEASFYPVISSNQQGILTQETTMDGMKEISPGRNMQFNPYVSFRSFHALDTRDPNQARFSNRFADMRAGLDSKFVVKDALVLDVTVNPDFAQVESDEPQNTVNQRFEVYFPEKRPFFQENAGYFQTPIELLFTRRIIDPTFGVRLTGKTGKWGIGTLLADDRAPGKSVPEWDPLSGKSAYFGVIRVTRDLWKDSYVGVIYTDRELATVPNSVCTDLRCTVAFNRVGGVDGRFQLSKLWVVDGQAVTSETKYNDGTRVAGPSYQIYAERTTRALEFNTLYNDTSPGFQTEAGFYRRPDIRRFSNFVMYRFYQKEQKKFVWHGPSLFTYSNWDHNGLKLEDFVNANYRFAFKGQTIFGVYGNTGHERLRPIDYPELPDNQDYKHYQVGFFFNTAISKMWSFNSEMNWGQDTNYTPRVGPPTLGKSNFVQAGLNIRPAKGLTNANTYLLSRLSDNLTKQNIFNAHIIRSKWNYQFTNAFSLRFIGQYDSVISNPIYTTLQNTKNFNFDVLFTYLVHPGTAVYVGYNSNLSNLDPSLTNTPDGLMRNPDRFINDGRQLFVKVSYLFRY